MSSSETVAERPKAKLTESEIHFIRGVYSSGLFTQAQLAEIFEVSRPEMRSILRSKKWKRLKLKEWQSERVAHRVRMFLAGSAE